MTSHRITIRRILALPLPYAAVFALFDACNVPRDGGFVLALTAGTALAGIVLIYRRPWELVATGLTMAVTTVVGLTMSDPCTSLSVVIGPVIGFFVFRGLNRMRPARPSEIPRHIASVERHSGFEVPTRLAEIRPSAD
jgi:hypothetical protein